MSKIDNLKLQSNMKKEENNNSGLQAVAYEAPVVEVIEVEVERGFALSNYRFGGSYDED